MQLGRLCSVQDFWLRGWMRAETQTLFSSPHCAAWYKLFYLEVGASFPSLQRKELKARGVWHPTPVLLPGKSHGQRSLMGCSPWGLKESDMTELLHFYFSLLCTGEGNGNPFQCSCLENPRDGVAQSQTRLKWLSSSSSSSPWAGLVSLGIPLWFSLAQNSSHPFSLLSYSGCSLHFWLNSLKILQCSVI